MSSTPRRPWWPAVLAAACLTYFAVLFISDLRRPAPLGMTPAFDERGMRLVAVDADSAAGQADLRAGDRIDRVGSIVVRRRIDALAADTHLAPGRPATFTIERGGASLTRTLVVPASSWRYWLGRQGIALLIVRGVQLATLVLACILLFKRPRDRHALLGAWLLATVAIFSVTLPYGFSHTWRTLPWPVGVLLLVPYVMSVLLAAVAFTFFASFPRPLVRGSSTWALLWMPMAIAAAWHGWYGWHVVYAPERVYALRDLSWFLVGVSVLYGAAFVAVLILNYRRLEDVTDRRRLKVLIAGTLVGSLAGGPVAVLYWIGPGRDNVAPLFASPLASIGVLTFLAMPLSFAHAILRHRLFDVSVIVRRGLQYALARRVLVSAVPALAAILALDLLVHADRPLAETINAHGPIYLVLGVLAVVAHARREAWLDGLDRRFFRERYNAQQILRRIVEDIRTGGDLPTIAARVVAQIEHALHPAFAALMARAPGDQDYRCIAVWPGDRAPAPLRRQTRLVELMGVLRRPADVSLTESAWIRRELPQEEMAYLAAQQIDLLVPAGSHALLALGAKQSEEPYSGEDEDLLATIGESLAIRFAHDERAEAAAGRAFEECPQCGACYDSGATVCARDGTALRFTSMPRVLAGRYRLDRRLGLGGMGTVYAATDTALSRRVAAKVMRDELTASAEAAERFQREAQLAASLTHPNVVTVYDFGVFERRAFLVMELLDGRTLRDELRLKGPLGAARALEILRGVAAAVNAAHERHLVHRDLKPENIFLSTAPHGEAVKVLDFGVAKMLAPAGDWPGTPLNTADGVLLGTLPYIAPEQLRGEPVSAASDVWALAVIAHEMLAGRHPFAGPSASAVRAPERAAPPPGAGLAAFFARALSADPAERPGTAALLLADLERAVATA